jgi:hypothetical protein
VEMRGEVSAAIHIVPLELNRSAVVEYSSCVSLTFLNVNMS